MLSMILRAISAVFGMLTLWIAWLGARECLGTLGGATVALLLALHPQFAIVVDGRRSGWASESVRGMLVVADGRRCQAGP